MSTGDRELLRRATELHRPIVRAAKIGKGNGMGYAIFGCLSLLLACTDWDLVGFALGAALLGIGIFERAQSARLLHADAGAPLRLARGELTLLGVIALYGILGLTVLPSAGAALKQHVGNTSGLGLDIGRLADSISTVWYATVIAVSLLYQGGMARYFLGRRSDMTRYLLDVPTWTREFLESMAG
jgi:hypothetical protein